MQKINYKKLMEQELLSISQTEKKPTLLLHACCAPCASAVLEVLVPYFEITLFFYNPNIEPEEEFMYRLHELERLLVQMELTDVSVVAPPYDAAEFESLAKGQENLPEGGARCRDCYSLRLNKTAAYAKEKGFDYVTTTLSVSPYKNAAWLNEIGSASAQKHGVRYLVSDFKKGEGYKRSCQLSTQFNLYRQNFCGCKYSRSQAEV